MRRGVESEVEDGRDPVGGESAACGSGRRVVAESGQDEWGSRT